MCETCTLNYWKFNFGARRRHVIVCYQCWNVCCMQTVWRSINVNSISDDVAVVPGVMIYLSMILRCDNVTFLSLFSRLFSFNNYFMSHLHTHHVGRNSTGFVIFLLLFDKKILHFINYLCFLCACRLHACTCFLLLLQNRNTNVFENFDDETLLVIRCDLLSEQHNGKPSI